MITETFPATSSGLQISFFEIVVIKSFENRKTIGINGAFICFYESTTQFPLFFYQSDRKVLFIKLNASESPGAAHLNRAR